MRKILLVGAVSLAIGSNCALARNRVADAINSVGDSASDLVQAADVMQPNIQEVADKAIEVGNRILLMESEVQAEPSEASDYIDTIKKIAADQVLLGAAIVSLSDAKHMGEIDCKDPHGKDPWSRRHDGECGVIVTIDNLAGALENDGTTW